MGWRSDSSAGAAIWDTEPLTTSELALRDEELTWLMRQGRHQWRLINGRIARKGDPVASLGPYTSLGAQPVTQAQTPAVLATATPGTCLWTSTIWTPIPANTVVGGQGFHCVASGTVQTSTTGQTLTLLPSIGTGTVNTAPTNNQPLGVSGAATLGNTLTSIWFLHGDLTIRSPGTAGTAWFMGTFHYGNTAAPVASGATLNTILGGTQATVDFTGATAAVPGGFQLSGFGAVTITIVTQQVHWSSL